MFPQSNIVIRGGNFSHTELRFETAFEKLQRASAPNAFHNSSARFDPPKCHPNTRVAILEYLMEWIFGRNDPEALILWLYGPAGAGKSAILQTIAERCFERKILLASFFFSRSDSTRNTFKPLIATIAYQIAIALPEIKPVLESIIERDPLIFDKSIATQLHSLIVDPLKDLAASGFFNDPSNCARLILIDGLDECDDPRMQAMILRALADALRDHKLPLIFLIASRPEQRISLTFNSPSLAGIWSSLVLDDSYEPDDDIRLFLTDSFQEIKFTHPHCHLIPEAWPEPSDIDKLVQKSSGQFIYSSVVVKYISAPVDRPPRRLEVVMGLRPARRDVPFGELDALYKHILASCDDPDTVYSILGLFMSKITTNVDTIEFHLDLEPGDVEIALTPLASLLNVLRYTSVITLHHASFGDFLIDGSRSGSFYINTLTIKEDIILKTINKLMNPYSIAGHEQPGRRLLAVLAEPFHPSIYDVPLTERFESALRGFSLPKFWSIWSSGPHGITDGYSSKAYFVARFLSFLSGNKDAGSDTNEDDYYPPPPGFSMIYEFHLSSFESIIQSEVAKYYQDVGLTSLIVISILDTTTRLFPDGSIMRMVSHLTDESEKFDIDSLSLLSYGRDLLATRYQYLFTGPRKSAEVCLDGKQFAQVALSMLRYLCARPSRYILYQARPSTRPSPALPFSKVWKVRLTDNSFLRKRREEKHRHGVAISIAPEEAPSSESFPREACDLGLSLLPYILESSSNSAELKDFMRRYGKDIVFVPKQTRKAICAMHKYLDCTDEEKAMTELREKFAAMVIR